MHDALARNQFSDLPCAVGPVVTTCGFYLALRPGGFTLHMSASAANVSRMRRWVFAEVCGAGAGEEAADAARLVASELVANAVRECGAFAPVVVRVDGLPDEVRVDVHDPEQYAVPKRRQAPPDNGEWESGRGLWMLDVLAPGWTVERTDLGKQVRCRVPLTGRNCA
ncbi:ATP-binding protein [Streptomyces sp. H10-C2]|uniref:ATP-binding protein n=1 Tax=unclassified Streptomyces TaxID=2593676 RepID=UPI0024BAFC28|nr:MULTISPECIES: ATP-binding protein [unclassified Streptomyces]MDJ0347180.1 ATP-binding protein [Streptomyces sp. PH10-H1]MDJ0375391.1 ATP-binding protein [Streptomyces sp. H10-C2]